MLPFAHAGLITGRPGLMAIYPVIVSLALITAAIGMLLTMTLVRFFGARRAKTVTQILAALIGAAFFLLSQLQSFLPREQQAAVSAWAKREMATGGWFAPESMLWWPVKAMLGEIVPLFAVIIAGVGSFWLVVNIVFKRFASGSQESMRGGTTTSRIRTDAKPAVFRHGLVANLLAKEWKLLMRDPQIISQTLLQILYLLPLLFLGFKGDRSAWLLLPGFVMITSMLAGSLAWLTIAAEDAPELIGTAPISMERVRRIKALAAVLPVFALLLPLVLYWLTRDAYVALVLIFCSTGGMMSAALCQVWNPREGNRRDMKRRYKGNTVVNILESIGGMGWAGAAICMNGHWWWLPLALAAIVIGPGTAWIIGRGARRSGALA
jgi:ABC-2 type transport system permease protein